MAEGPVIPIEIHGQRYPIRSSLDPEYVARLARYVDQRMRAAGDSTHSGDSLQLATEVGTLREERDIIRTRVSEMLEQLEGLSL
jgi:cell division protein ZapA (FtsZ GTPase activity inhibitor)